MRASLVHSLLAFPIILAGCQSRDALHHASMDGDLRKVESLLQGGADANARDGDGQLPIELAMWGLDLERSVRIPIIQLLLAHGASPNAIDSDGCSLLADAIMTKDHELARILLDAGADIEVADRSGSTPIHWAVWSFDLEMTEVLVSRGASLAFQSGNGETLLHTAAKGGNSTIVGFLLRHGLDPNATDNERGRAPLHWAAGHAHPDVVRLLLEAGAEATMADADGNLPLDWAEHYDAVNGGPLSAGYRDYGERQEAVMRVLSIWHVDDRNNGGAAEQNISGNSPVSRS